MTIRYPWLTACYQQLISAFSQGRGHHALLFKTDRGLGAETLILQLAQWLFCRDKKQAEPCGECKSCLLWQSGNHPDFHSIESLDGKDIGVDQIREITAKLQQFSQQGGETVVYIKQAERLTEAAANALLKTLEEPNDKIYFLLQAPLQAPLLATIQSRCQTWLLNAPSLADGVAWLQSVSPTTSSDDLLTALRLNHRQPLSALHFIEQDKLAQRKSFLQSFWRFYKSRDLLLLLSAFDKDKNNALQQLDWLASFFSDALKAKLNIADNWMNPDLQNGIFPFSQALSAVALLRGEQIIRQTQQDLSTINAVNQELMLMDGLSKLILDVFE